jgi:hypothetical protein
MERLMSGASQDRAVSSPLGYILNLSIAAIVLVSLGAVGTVFFDANTGAAIEEDLEAYGNDLAGDIQSVDRLAAATPGRTADKRASLAESVRGTDYIVEVINSSDAGGTGGAVEHADACERQCLVLVTHDGDVRTTVNFVSATPVESSRFEGGPVVVRRPAGGDRIQFDPLE